jgi:hypothetical protein
MAVSNFFKKLDIFGAKGAPPVKNSKLPYFYFQGLGGR